MWAADACACLKGDLDMANSKKLACPVCKKPLSISCQDIPAAKTYYFGYDGQGSVRYLTDTDGNITDTYDYDAFGNLIHRTGTTDNNYLYTGSSMTLIWGCISSEPGIWIRIVEGSGGWIVGRGATMNR
jgi:YD repeat-containing protein